MENPEQVIQDKSQQSKTRFSWKLYRRLLAVFMAVVLILSMVLGYAAQIRFGQLQYLGTVLEHAAAVTAENTGYLSESTLKRAWNILKYAVGKPKTYDEYDMYASLAIARTEYDEAIPYMQGCIDRYPGENPRDLAMLHMRLGSLYALCDDIENSVVCFDKAVQTEPNLADAYLLRAQMNSLLGNQELAVEDIRRYDALAGDAPAIRAAVGSLYESAGDYESAVACYTLGLEQSGGTDPDLLAARGRCQVLLQKMDAARQDFVEFFANGGTDPTGEYNLMLGLCQMEEGKYSLARNSFRNALNVGYGQTALIYSQCVLCDYIIGDYASVIEDGEKALEAMTKPQQLPDTGALTEGIMSAEELHHWIGLAKMAGEDFEGAREEFLKIQDFSKSPAGVPYYLGLCCSTLGHNEEAVTHYTRSIEDQQMVSLALYNRGVSYLQLQKTEEGLTDLITVLQRNDDPDASSAAAALLQELGVNVVFES